jgi:hypothetical protein
MSLFYNCTVSQNDNFVLKSKSILLMKSFIPYVLSVCLITGFAFLVPENVFSQTSQGGIKTEETDSPTTRNEDSYTYVKGITTGRAISLVGGVMGLISLIIGWRAKVRSSQKGAKIAITLGLLAIFSAIVHLSVVAGAVFGSGSGKAGSLAALPLAIIGAILGGLTLRSRNTD